MHASLGQMTHILLVLACVLVVGACSLDSGGGGAGGAGASGGNSGVGGSAGFGGNAGIGGGTPVSPTFEECQLIVEAQSGGRVAFACSFCLCSPPENRNQVTACDGLCWDLIECVGKICGIGGANQLTCATNNCGPFLGGAGSATALSSRVQTCQPECGAFVSP